MAHHLDYHDPTLDVTDVFCFRGSSGTVFVLNVGPREPAGFNSDGMYELKVDTNGDAIENLTLRVTFPVIEGAQRIKLEQLTGRAARDRNATGTLLKPTGAPASQQYTGNLGDKGIVCSNGIKVFAGERGEPFYNDPRLLLEIKRALKTGTAPDFSTFDPNTSQNFFGNSNVSAIVVEAPRTVTGTGTIGFWGNSAGKQDGAWHQAQHAADPVIGFLWDFAGGSSATNYNASHPKDHLDAKNARSGVWKQVRDETAAVVAAMGTYDKGTYGKPTSLEYGQYVADTIFPDVLLYKVGTAASYGPIVPNGARDQNGRGLTEDSMEAIFEVVLNTHVEMGLDSSDATGTLLNTFPYLSEPVGAAVA